MRLIDADALYLAIVTAGQENKGGRYKIGDIWELNCEELREVIYAQPTVDAMPVVRCKDCKWYYRGGATCMYWDGENNMHGDDYCSRAERKEE